VREAFWKQEPQVKEVLAELVSPRVFIVPLFISEGYFAGRVIPRELGFHNGERGASSRVLRREGRTLFYCQPVGTHQSMIGVLLARALEVVRQSPFPHAPEPRETSLFLAGHGTGQSDDSREAIDRQAERIRALGFYHDVHAVFLEESPRIGECYQLARTNHLVVVPFFISDGLHAKEDIPVLLGEPKQVVERRLRAGHPAWRNPTEREGKLVWYSPSIGSEPLLADVIIERVRDAQSNSRTPSQFS
jgi:sirohydrochlorin cobaltochelatase